MARSRPQAPDPGGGTPAAPPEEEQELIDAVLAASRVLVAMAARSLAGMKEDLTLPQFRAMVVLASRGPQRVADLAAELDVNASTATRMCDRLVRKALVTRARTESDRRTVRVRLTPAGQQRVEEVTARRRAEITRIIGAMPRNGRSQLVTALRTFTKMGGAAPEQDWSLGWE